MSRKNCPETHLRWLPVLLAGLVLSAKVAAAPLGLNGVWVLSEYQAAFAPIDRGEAPLTAAGRALFDSHRSELLQNPPSDGTHSACTPPGIPRSLAAPYPFEILQTESQVDFIFEVNRAYRFVLLQAAHQDPQVWDPSYMGDATGRWEQNELVIDSRNFNDATWLDDSGLPHSDQLHVTERLKLERGGRGLLDRITIEDPLMYSHAWSVNLHFERREGVRVQTDWVCGGAHRAVDAIRNAVSYR